MTETKALEILKAINQAGATALRGTAGIAAVQQAIAMTMARAGVSIAIDPTSVASLLDYLVVGGTTALDDAMWGALIGALVGMAFGRPAVGLAIGAGLGATVGGARGVGHVRRGQRVRTTHDRVGPPILGFARR